MADLDPGSLTKLRVVDLKEHLSNRGLSTSGLKAELVKRLKEALLSESKQDGDTAEPMAIDSDSEDENQSPSEDVENQMIEDESESESLKFEEELKRKEEEKRLEEERLKEVEIKRIEEERLRVEEEKMRVEQEKLQEEKRKNEERQKLEAEKKRKEEEQKRREEEIKREEEKKELEREKKRLDEERKRIEEKKRREEERKYAEEKKRREDEERKRADERKRAEERKRCEEEERKRAEDMKRRKEEKKRAEEEEERKRAEAIKRHKEEERKRAEEKEEERKRAEAIKRHKEEERKRAEEIIKREEEERKRAEEIMREEAERKHAEESRKAQELRQLEEMKRLEEEKVRAEAKKRAEDERLKAVAEKRRVEEEKLREEEEKRRLEREKRQAEEKRIAEEKRRADEEKRIAEEKRRADEEKQIAEEKRRADEEKRIAVETERRMAAEEEMKKEQERWLVEEQMRRAQEEHKKRIQTEEQKRHLEEQQRLMEEEIERQSKEQQLFQIEQKVFVEQENRQFNQQPDITTSTSLHSSSSPFINTPTIMNIMPPPPTVLMSNIPPPPVISTLAAIAPNVQVSAPPTRFPVPPVTQPFMTPLIKETNSIISNDLSPEDIIEIMDTTENTADIKLPHALEKVLALKTERAQQLGIDPDAVVQNVPVAADEKALTAGKTVVTLVSIDEDEFPDEDEMNKKESKSRRRKKKKKKKRQIKTNEKSESNKRSESAKSKETSVDIDIEYVQEVIDISDPLYTQFMKVFEKFKLTDGDKEKEETAADSGKDVNKDMFNPMAIRKKPIDLDDDDDDDDQDDDKKEEDKPKLSKRKLKKLSRMTVAELKQKVNRPELVEMHDVTAKDPVLLLHLKASRNTVPVPRHWCFKRKYLQGKRGIEKPAFELPDFIKRTGIMEMRQALQEKEDQKTMKAKMRERVRPKLGKIDIDYQKLHDAFFKWQTKPRMTIHGDLYYEGKEFETRLKEKKPGDLSEDLRTALGMPTGPNANKCPPPWLIAMQRYGPPPSYPNLKIPGLNAPIPDSCSFGYHAGGWGKPPVDETGRPLYGDVFGTQIIDNQPHIQEEEIDHTLWGELESESSEEEEEEDEEEEEEEEEKQEDETGLVTPAEGLITPSGFSSIPAGMETPDMIELRKRKIEAKKEGGETPALYTILPEKKTERVGAAMMGSTHIYDLAAAIPASKMKMAGTTSVPPQGIEVALDPSELEMDTAAMAARYEQTMREQQSQLEKEDLSDMVAEHAARQKNKRKKQQLDSAKPPKKYKEFKF